MGDDESRRDDARQEAAIDKAIRDGRIAYCHHCGDQDWVEWVDVYDDEEPVPLCRDCKKAHEAKY